MADKEQSFLRQQSIDGRTHPLPRRHTQIDQQIPTKHNVIRKGRLQNILIKQVSMHVIDGISKR